MTGKFPVDFGFMLPQVFTETAVDLKVVETVAVRAEQAGLHSLWTQAQVVGKADVLEPLTLLSYVAAMTNRIRLGTSVLIVTEHTPVQLAKLVSSLDVISNGRVMVGLGMGAPLLRLQMGGFEMDRPVRRLIETADILKALFSDGPANYQGRIWQLNDVDMNPKPRQRPTPPIWLGGRHPDGLRRAVKHGTGWMGPGGASTADFGSYVQQIRQILAEQGRDPAQFTIAKRIYIAVEGNRAEAERRIKDRFEVYSKNGDKGTEVSVYGTADDVAAGIQEVIDLGAQLVVLNPLYDFVRQQEALFEIINT
ncbi:LLM class flavin-dependent oxidoreductase [Micromonospora cremea]|uniref:Probable F420-dependent oxidoreductase, Rv2161c family n=1 Tax=Micromonospora cremea TaxID=709881 RepID=A0A1N5VH15_9ACTN|nr:LLM class flavin-dependent oxidoreductase [Micromonospora cremea]SIM72452.1 probable F420-dependent oxidoreductase, Rv2161c family [Micromonospora cremea]